MARRKTGRKTQCDMIVEYLAAHDSITPLDALKEYGIFRLAARIYDLRRAGLNIKSDSITTANWKGDPVTFGRYSLLTDISI